MKELTEQLSEYRSTIIKERKIEKELEAFFQLLAVREDPRYDRCIDYGERVVQITIPFDEINITQFTVDNIEEIKNKILEYRKLRSEQKRLENEIHQQEAVRNIMKQDIGAFGGDID